jgi:hypothetical protein
MEDAEALLTSLKDRACRYSGFSHRSTWEREFFSPDDFPPSSTTGTSSVTNEDDDEEPLLAEATGR